MNKRQSKKMKEKKRFTANSSDASSDASRIRNRASAMMGGGYDDADTLHNIYYDFGYPTELEFSNFWNMYRRFGIAANIVETFPDMCWIEPPLIESSDKVLNDISVIDKSMSIWTRVKGLDTRQRVGRYGGLFMRVRDNKPPSEPIDGVLSGVSALVDMIPLYESQLDVVESETDPRKDNYGQPLMYQFTGSVEGNRNEDVRDTFNIHPSRVVTASEGSDNGSIYGLSSLERVYNSLMDLRKIIGAGGEGFYKNAAQSTVFDLKDPSSASVNADLLNEFNENYDDFARNRSRRAIWTPGMDAKTLQSSLANPKEYFMNALYDVASGSKMPVAELIGNQTGALASEQDKVAFLRQVQSRKEHFGTGLVKSVVDWLMLYGLLPTDEYIVTWNDSLAASSDEKLSNADKMSDINQKAFQSGAALPFEAEEIREVAGFKLDGIMLEEPSETIDEVDLK